MNLCQQQQIHNILHLTTGGIRGNGVQFVTVNIVQTAMNVSNFRFTPHDCAIYFHSWLKVPVSIWVRGRGRGRGMERDDRYGNRVMFQLSIDVKYIVLKFTQGPPYFFSI